MLVASGVMLGPIGTDVSLRKVIFGGILENFMWIVSYCDVQRIQ